MNKKYWLFLLAIVVVISISANVYSFNKLSNEESEINKKNILSISEKEDEIAMLNEEIELLNSKSETIKEDVETNEKEEDMEVEVKNISDLENAAERFIDYNFNVNEENYATVKTNADNYMTDEMVETLFTSDGITDEEINLKTSVENIEVFTTNLDEKKAIVQYEIKLDYGNGFKETLKPFVLLYFTTENEKLKVSELQAINDIGGI